MHLDDGPMKDTAWNRDLCLFSLNWSRTFGQKVAAHLGIELSAHEEREFEDGEHKVRSQRNVRDRDVYLITSLYGEPGATVNDKLCRLLFFVGALKDAGAGRVTALVPYLCYARKDRKTKARDPVTTRYLACLFEAVGCDRIVTLDVHNLAAFQNAFRCPTEHLEAKQIFAQFFGQFFGQSISQPYTQSQQPKLPVVIAPDFGGIKRAEAFRQALSQQIQAQAKEALKELVEVPLAFAEKYRSSGVVSGSRLSGDIHGRVAIILDDLISSGTTLARTAQACLQQGASEVYAAATHGVFAPKANEILAIPELSGIVVTDTVEPFRLTAQAVRDKLTVLETAPLFAEAIQAMHSGGSIVALLGEPA